LVFLSNQEDLWLAVMETYLSSRTTALGP